MIWHSKDELEKLGPPTRKSMLWVVIGFPILLLQLGAEIIRLLQALSGQPLVISKRLGIYVVWGESPVQYLMGLIFHLVLLVILALLFWGCSLWLQQWVYFRRH